MPVPIPPATPSTPPVAPQRTEPTTFSARMDAWLAWFNASFWVWVYDLVPWIQARANETEAWSNTASASAAAASVSQATAAEAITVANTAMVTVTQQAAAAAATSGTISSVAAAASASASSASTSSTAAAVSAERAVQAWAAASAPDEQLASISKSLHVGTVVKAIIYDTSKDSDGGAWRKRMQDKSWYNETLGGNAWIGQQPSEAVARAYVGSLASPQLVTNGTFDTGTSGWTAQSGLLVTWSSGELRGENSGGTAGSAYQGVATVIGQTYRVSATFTTAASVRVAALTSPTTGVLAASTFAAGNRTDTISFVATGTTTYISVGLSATTSGLAFTADNISVKIVDTAIPTADYLYQSTADGKFYKTNGNLLADTNGFFNQWSTDSVATRNSVSVTTPDGSATVIQLVSAVGGAPYVYTNPVVVSGNTYTYSMYVKLGTGGDGTVRLDNTTRSANATFNLSTGAAGAVTNCTSAIVSVGSGWYRCSMTYTATTSAANTHDIVLLGTFSAGQGHYIWGAQLELGSVVQSYKPVTTTYAGSQTEVFRGISREFPAVAAIVAESARVVIYDLTQSGAPMWMVFTNSGMAGYSTAISSIAMGQGQTLVGAANGLTIVSLIQDGADYIQSGNRRGQLLVSSRNSTVLYQKTTPYIVGMPVNDVAITVLDTAPIDPSTGLPVPTIAVATAGGISVLRDNGTVVSHTCSGYTDWKRVGYTSDFRLWAHIGNDDRRIGFLKTGLSTVSTTLLTDFNVYSDPVAGGQFPYILGNVFSRWATTAGRDVCGAGSTGAFLFKTNHSAFTKSMQAQITNSYNSGWQVGDSRGAYLADTTAETIAASGELVTNGTFTTDTSGWTASFNSVLAVVSGELRVTTTDQSAPATQSFSTTVGKTYLLTGTLRIGTASAALIYAGTTAGNSSLASYSTASATNVTQTLTFVATGTTTFVGLQANGVGVTAFFDNISVKLAEPDRSVKNTGLVLNGTLTKTAVASGAGLVAYSGFSGANYLEQPYNANLDFGTGDFCVMGWVNHANTTSPSSQVLLDRSAASGGSLILLLVAGVVYYSAHATYTATSTSHTAVAGLNHYALIRLSGVIYFYVNGVQVYTVANTQNITNAAAALTLGTRYDKSAPLNNTGSMALWRISATAPSADQIAHIYRTELPLFQANAQCTIAGTSTAVTALAYDDVADELHVGTSWGRSEFKDLLRVASEATTTGSITSLAANEGVVINAGTSAKIYAPALYLRDELRRTFTASRALAKQLMWQEFYATEGQTTFTCSKNGDVRAVYVNNILRKAPVDYTVSSDGFQNIITFTSGISAGIQVSVQTTRS